MVRTRSAGRQGGGQQAPESEGAAVASEPRTTRSKKGAAAAAAAGTDAGTTGQDATHQNSKPSSTGRLFNSAQKKKGGSAAGTQVADADGPGPSGRDHQGGNTINGQHASNAEQQQLQVLAPKQQQPNNNRAGELDAFRHSPQLAAALARLHSSTQDTSVFLRPNQEVSESARQAAKALYAYAYQHTLGAAGGRAARRALRHGSAAPLPELYTDAQFDAEQIYLQLEAVTDALLRQARRLVAAAEPLADPATGAASRPCGGLVSAEAAVGIEQLLAGGGAGSDDEFDDSDDDMDDDDEGPSGSGLDDDSGDEDEQGGVRRARKRQRVPGSGSGVDDDDDDDLDLLGAGGSDGDDDDEDDDGVRAKGKGKKDGKGGKDKASKGKGSKDKDGLLPVEDRFMKLSDMEKFLQDAERRAAGGSSDDELNLGASDEDGEGDDDADDSDEDLQGALDGLGAGGDDDGDDDDDDDMAALVRGSAKLVGKKVKDSGGKQARKKAAEEAQARYDDFFGGKGLDADEDDDDDDEHDGDNDDDEDEDGAAGLSGEDDEDEDEDMDELGEDDDDEAGGQRGDVVEPAGASKAGAARQQQQPGKALKPSKEQLAALSTHERRLLRLQEQIAEMESEALSDKHWTLVGEAQAQRRPINSALEVDMDFDTTVKPPPQPTEEMTNDIEELIKKRIAAHKFDDVIRVVPPPLEKKKKDVELDDSKAQQGLGELYEADYVRAAAGGAAEDKAEPARQAARALFKALCAKLDALTRFHYAPKPVIEDMSIKSEVAAVVMEEAAPVAVSKASMQLPGEVYAPTAAGAPKAEAELSREERKQRRAKRKRVRKAQEETKMAEKRALAASQGGEAPVLGRKSDAKVVAGRNIKVAEGAGAKGYGKTDMGNSSAVFAKLAAEQQAGGRLPKDTKKKDTDGAKDAAMLKL